MKNTALTMVPYFRDLDEGCLKTIENNSTLKFFPKGSFVFQVEDRCTHLYIVKSGLIRIYINGEDGREITIHYVDNGKFLGDTILFNEEHYGANAAAIEDTELIVIENRSLEKIIHQYPEIGIRMLADFGHRLKRMMSLMGEMALSDVRKRLLRLLSELAKEHGVNKNGKIILDRVTTQEEMAWRIGTTREVLCRELHRLEKEGVLAADRGKIVINDLNSLKERVPAHDDPIFPMKRYQ